jgi:hypothetical protein
MCRKTSAFENFCYKIEHYDDYIFWKLVRKETQKNKSHISEMNRKNKEERLLFVRNYNRFRKDRKEYIERQKRKSKISYKILKYNVFSAYSNGVIQCACCGQLEYGFLTIDHIKPKRDHYHAKNMSGVKLFRWLKYNAYPDGYQILCYNCNISKRLGVCIHQKLKTQKFVNTTLQKDYQNKLKNEVISYYSNGEMKCACCDERTLDFLSIDHINGRKQFNHGFGFGGYPFHLWLKKNNFPDGFRILCYNCNCYLGKRGNNKICIHKVREYERKIEIQIVSAMNQLFN